MNDSTTYVVEQLQDGPGVCAAGRECCESSYGGQRTDADMSRLLRSTFLTTTSETRHDAGSTKKFTRRFHLVCVPEGVWSAAETQCGDVTAISMRDVAQREHVLAIVRAARESARQDAKLLDSFPVEENRNKRSNVRGAAEPDGKKPRTTRDSG